MVDPYAQLRVQITQFLRHLLLRTPIARVHRVHAPCDGERRVDDLLLRGIQYVSLAYTDTLAEHGVAPSVDSGRFVRQRLG